MSRRKVSAFALEENGYWQQPTIWADESKTDDQIRDAILLHYGRKYFAVYGIDDDEACPDEDVIDLGAQCWA